MVKDYNKIFNPLTAMTWDEFNQLIQEKRLWSTRALFNQHGAKAVMGQPPVGFHYPAQEVYYHGCLITEVPMDLQEATDIAGRRGFGEEVVWLVEDTGPLGDHPNQLFLN